MPLSPELERELERERRAFEDMFYRISRNDLDCGYYEDPADKPRTLREKLRRLFEKPPDFEEPDARA